MATPKFDTIIKEFRARVADIATFDITGSLLDGNTLPASDTVTYVNRALFRFEEDAWVQSQGNKWNFVKVFPEMIVEASASFVIGGYGGSTNGTNYTIASPYLDFLSILDSTTGSQYIKVQEPQLLSVIDTGINTQYTATSINMFLIVDGRTLYLYPSLGGSGYTGVKFRYVKSPLVPTTGTPIIQNGSIDSPFYEIHTTKIAEIAEQLYRIDAQLS